MPANPDVILVSNRGPVSFTESATGFDVKRGAGGLAGAIDPVARALAGGAVWIAAANSDVDRRAVGAGAGRGLAELLGYEVRLIDIDADVYSAYYDTISNRMLWFANHCLLDELAVALFAEGEVAAWDRAYEPVNKRFAASAAEAAGDRSLVLFQDYHLSLAPMFLRAERPEQTIMHFTHSSFCCEGLERLPEPIPQRIVMGMLGADLVGFHTDEWAGHFLECCAHLGLDVNTKRRSVHHEGHTSWVRHYPIQIDSDALRKRSKRPAVAAWGERFGDRGDELLVVRADRAEPSKNIVRGFEAFGALLDRRADLVGRTRFVACLYPSRQSMVEYRDYTARIHEAVRAVESRHPGSIELFLEDDYDRTLGALMEYDVLIVNSIMDGMNLVSKEGPGLNRRSGALVLSRHAGSFQELEAGVYPIDDPLDVTVTASALEQAIDAEPSERARRARLLSEVAGSASPQDWIAAQLDDLRRIQKGEEPGPD